VAGVGDDGIEIDPEAVGQRDPLQRFPDRCGLVATLRDYGEVINTRGLEFAQLV
jgi:hypothetical protein